MGESLHFMLAAILCVGIFCVWIATIANIPSILPLLISGVLLGPVFNIVDIGKLFGEFLYPFISVSVALILFEGGLSLKLQDIEENETSLTRLLTASAVISFALITILSQFILNASFPFSLLLAAILIVTGPTVVGPLLRSIRPNSKLFSILHWEGIIIDPIGALTATILFEVIISFNDAASSEIAQNIFFDMCWTLLGSTLIAYVLSKILIICIQKFIIPDHLQNPVTLGFVVFGFSISNMVVPESGLFTTTAMGLILANQWRFPIHHIIEFKENLRVLLISTAFIVLSANISREQLLQLELNHLLFAMSLVFLVRPIATCIALIGSNTDFKERFFIAFMAPRGIVAAAIASIFAPYLGEEGAMLAPITFCVIAFTVFFYGVFSPLIARLLQVSNPNPNGVLIIGGNTLSYKVAELLHSQEVNVIVLDGQHRNLSPVNMLGIPSILGEPLEEDTLVKIPFGEIGTVLVLGFNEKSNSLISTRFRPYVGGENIYEFSHEEDLKEATDSLLRAGRVFIDTAYSFTDLIQAFSAEEHIRKTEITEQYTIDDLLSELGSNYSILFKITSAGKVIPRSIVPIEKAAVGETLISVQNTVISDSEDHE